MQHKISVIVPVYKEENNICEVLMHLAKRAQGYEYEAVVVDGAPDMGTLSSIPENMPDVLKLHSSKGRSLQMNTGANSASGDILLFLHADTLLPLNAFNSICKTMDDAAFCGGAFRLKLDSNELFLKLVSFTASLRPYITGIPFGDQAIFMKKKYFMDIGGFKEIPLMEDTELMKRVKRSGGKISIIKDPVVSSARKWHKDGLFFNTFKNHLVRFLYWAGVSPKRLYEIYYRN
jgi:rSAM/selenodomain-associated transferase 2